MPAYPYQTGTTYLHTKIGKTFTVISIDEHDFDPELTEVEIEWQDGGWQRIYADEFSHDIDIVTDAT